MDTIFGVELVVVPGMRDDELMMVPAHCAREIERLAWDSVFGRLHGDEAEQAIENLVRYAVPRSAVVRGISDE